MEISEPTPTPTETGTPTPTATTPGGNATPTPTAPGATVTPTRTPTPPDTNRSIEIQAQPPVITGGQTFSLIRTIRNGPYPVTASVYTLLEVYGYYYFWPSWSEDLDYRTMNLEADSVVRETLLEFEWPEDAGAGSATFWAALFAPMTWDLLADVDNCSFQWK
jgi:hypothetical protein